MLKAGVLKSPAESLMDKIDIVQEDDKEVMRVKVTYKEKEKSYPYIVVETNLSELPDRIELNTATEEK